MPRQALPLNLTPEQHRALQELAKRSGRSMSEVVRELLDTHLFGETPPTDISDLAGVVNLGHPTDIACQRGLRRESMQDQDSTRAWSLSREWSDQDFSLTDRQAFAVLERTRRLRAWSYDADFAVIRLGPARDRPLDLVL